MKIRFYTFYLNLKFLIAIFCIVFVSSLFGVYYSFANDTTDGIKLPIIMYHSVLKDPSRSGKYIITPSTLESDLRYIKEKGYTTITMSDLIAYVYENSPLPEKPIILTFDDGHYNNLGYVVPLLQQYEMKAVFSIVGSYTDTYTKSDEANLNYSYLRWKDINNLIHEENSPIEFQNHTYNLHSNISGRNGCKKKIGESTEVYQQSISEDIARLQEKFKIETGYVPNTFTYPFGEISKDSQKVLQDLGFKASLSCYSGINIITKEPMVLFQLKRNNRPSGISSASFFRNLLV